MVKDSKIPYPTLKWAGGKNSLATTFDEKGFIPNDFERYYEPFFGAGAIFFHLWKTGRVKKATVSDLNVELFNLYSIIKNDPEKIIEKSKELNLMSTSTNYYEKRERFNVLKIKRMGQCSDDELCERATLLIFLNKTCYSGIYRENKKGIFNVPFGSYPNPTIIDEVNLRKINESFADTKIMGNDFEKVTSKAKCGDFVYFDPPYMKCDNVSAFRDYHKIRFDDESQKRLCKVFEKLNKRGCKLMLSNSSSERLNRMYKDMKNVVITPIDAPRCINQKMVGRITVKEYVITNYPTMLNKTESDNKQV